MGAGKGNTRRLNIINNQGTPIFKRTKPKFNLDDTVSLGSDLAQIKEICYDRKRNAYDYCVDFERETPWLFNITFFLLI